MCNLDFLNFLHPKLKSSIKHNSLAQEHRPKGRAREPICNWAAPTGPVPVCLFLPSSLFSPSISRRYPVVQRHHLWFPESSTGISAQRTTSVTDEKDRVDNQKSNRVQDRGVTPRSEDFNAWYLDVIEQAELDGYVPVRGTMVIRPYGYAIWEAILDYLNVKFKETDHSNILYPTLFIEKEASHVEGFSPELALVTIGGGKELEEKLAALADSTHERNHGQSHVQFTQWIHSYRDLPRMVNQAIQMIDVYLKFAYEQAEVPVIAGGKSKVETFAGAVSVENESHIDGRRDLAWAYKRLGYSPYCQLFTDGSGQRQHVWQTSWAVSTPFVGGIIMTHGDDTGLMLPPKIAPIQRSPQRCIIGQRSSAGCGNKVKLDGSEQRTPRWKFNFWEMKVFPLRIEIGPRDVLHQSVVVSRTDVPGKQGKVFGISMGPFEFAGLCDGQVGKWARGPYNEEELKGKEETGATIRCSPFEQPQGIKRCLMTRNPAEEVSIFAKS
ncbi:unnamed protein product [Malus baccata var. baccata]